MARRGDRRQRVHAVMFALHLPLDHARTLTVVIDREALIDAARLLPPQRLPAALHAEALHLAPAAARENPVQRILAPVDDDPADARHRAHQVMKLGFDGGEIRENVGVIELEVVQDRRARPVVHEFRALVEKSGVVLVRFDHEEARIGQPRRHAEIHRHAADQKARIQTRIFEQPGEHRIVVVLPWVPATASTHLPGRTCSPSHCGPEI